MADSIESTSKAGVHGQIVVNPDGTDVGSGSATSINQETLNSLIETLQELIQRLAPLAGAVANTAQLRVVQTSVPSTAVTGPITSAQSIAEKNVGGVSYTTRISNENMAAIQSNINNVSVS